MSKAQQLSERLDQQFELLGVGGAVALGTMVARDVTTHRTRSKYGLHGDIHNHLVGMEKIRRQKLPGVEKHAEFRKLRKETIDTMAHKVHALRQKHDLKTTPSKAQRIARRAFHGTLSSAPAMIMPKTPHI